MKIEFIKFWKYPLILRLEMWGYDFHVIKYRDTAIGTNFHKRYGKKMPENLAEVVSELIFYLMNSKNAEDKRNFFEFLEKKNIEFTKSKR